MYECFVICPVDLRINVSALQDFLHVHHVLLTVLPERVCPQYFFALCPQRDVIVLLSSEAYFSALKFSIAEREQALRMSWETVV